MFLKEVPRSQKLPTFESLSFKISKLARSSPVAYKLWNDVSTWSSILLKLSKSSGFSTSSARQRNRSFRSLTCSKPSFECMMAKSWSWIYYNEAVRLASLAIDGFVYLTWIREVSLIAVDFYVSGFWENAFVTAVLRIIDLALRCWSSSKFNFGVEDRYTT